MWPPSALLAYSCACCNVWLAGWLADRLTDRSPYSQLDEDAPLTVAFASFSHTQWVRIAVDIGAVVGLSTCLLIGLYSQSR
jgi:APA family basic amino acid/polyamine antiporter